jgi:DNA-binding transcriptional regulator YdaS (Cro superfamily)
MEKLRTFLNDLSTKDQEAFADRCDTSVGYLRKAMAIGQQLGEKLVIAIERESKGKVRCEDLRPDVDWQFLRNTA